jgi:hypothetical protein
MRNRCRSTNSGFAIDAACFNDACNAGISSSASTRIPAPNRARSTVGGVTRIFVEAGAPSQSTAVPTTTRPAWRATRFTSPGLIRPSEDRNAH